MKVPSTYKILKSEAFNENIDDTWIDWALEMMEAGYQSDNLHMLAGAMKPFNQFEMQELTRSVLADLGFDYTDKDAVLKNYVFYLISKSINHPERYFKTLRELRDICQDLELDSAYMDFYLLYYGKDDLRTDVDQWYWDGAKQENIDQIIEQYFRTWIKEFEHKDTTTTA